MPTQQHEYPTFPGRRFSMGKISVMRNGQELKVNSTGSRSETTLHASYKSATFEHLRNWPKKVMVDVLACDL